MEKSSQLDFTRLGCPQNAISVVSGVIRRRCVMNGKDKRKNEGSPRSQKSRSEDNNSKSKKELMNMGRRLQMRQLQKVELSKEKKKR